MNTDAALAALAGFIIGIVVFAAVNFLIILREPDVTMCCGTSDPPCDDFHAEGLAERTYCERCHHHWTCHDTDYDRL